MAELCSILRSIIKELSINLLRNAFSFPFLRLQEAASSLNKPVEGGQIGLQLLLNGVI